MNGPRDLDKVKRELAAAGYSGQKFVFLVPTDLPAINAMSEVAATSSTNSTWPWITRPRLGYRRAAAVVAGAAGQRRLEPECELCPGFSAMSPAAHSFMRGIGRQALFGWPTMPKIEELRSAWIDATDPEEQKRLCREIQLQGFRTCRIFHSDRSFSPALIGAT